MKSEQHFAPIAALDLDPIKVKLMHEESGEGWSLAYADAIEFEYRRFLYLVKKYPNEQAAPRFDVDVFWHYHILDTMKYAADCETVFGYFLHHFPYVGLRGEEDLEAHHRAGERMRELYEQVYGEGYIRQGSPTYGVACGKVAFSSPARNEILPVGTDTVAFSSPMGKVAFCSPAGKVASSFPAEKFAFSSPMTESGTANEAVETAVFDAPGRASAAKFYTVRPTLSRPA